MRPTISFDARACLDVDPFEGDRDQDVLVRSDKIILPRKDHNCLICDGTARKATWCRARSEVDRDLGMAMTFYFCTSCCEAQAASWTDQGMSLTERYSIGCRLRGELPDVAA